MTPKRILFVFVKIAYLAFYLASPFFHYHHEDSIQTKEIEYHSHLFHEVKSSSNYTAWHHTFEDDGEHNHHVVIQTALTNLAQRFNNTFIKVFQFYYSVEIESENISFMANCSDDFHFGKIMMEKCVHSASNVSPPFIFTT